MQIAVIGTGNVGSVLGTRWARSGHTVVFGSRHPQSEKTQHVVAGAGPNASAAAIADAAAGADVVVLATPWSGTQAALAATGDLSNTIVVDCTNPIKPDRAGLALGTDTSGGEQVASWAGGARVVKAFNTTGSGNMADPRYGDQAITLFLCGDDAEAKQTVAGLAETLGFDVVDAGGITAARYLEPLAMLWVHLAYTQGHGPNIAFKLLRR